MAFKEKNLTKLIGVFSFKESFKMDFIFNLTKILNFFDFEPIAISNGNF